MTDYHGDDSMNEIAFTESQQPSTTCERVYALLQKMYAEGYHQPYEDAMVQLGNQLMAVTRTFGDYFLALDERIMNRDYGGALQIGRAMVEHEAMLHSIYAGEPVRSRQSLN